MSFEDANDLLKYGYTTVPDPAYLTLDDVKWTVAALTRMPRCRAKMVDWWTQRLATSRPIALWHPTDHVWSSWENRIDGKYIRQPRISSMSFSARTSPLYRLRVAFHDPAEDVRRPPLPRLRPFRRLRAPTGPARRAAVSSSRSCHFVRNTDLRLRDALALWLGHIAHRDPTSKIPEADMLELRAGLGVDTRAPPSATLRRGGWAISPRSCKRSIAVSRSTTHSEEQTHAVRRRQRSC